MKLNFLVAMSLLFLSSVGLSCPAHENRSVAQVPELPHGGRHGLHGMVLFGSGPYFLEHIPMLTPPHDFQIIAEVELQNKNGEKVKSNFSEHGFTLKPSASFSLNDYIMGNLKTFSGTIYQGSFETNGEVVPGLADVVIVVKSYKLIRQLPAQEKRKVVNLSDGVNEFESLIITPTQNRQEIKNKKSGVTLWCVKAPDFFESCDSP